MAYSTDADLAKIRPNILALGVSAWTDQRTEAEAIINRTLDVRWYRQAAQEKGLDWRDDAFDADRTNKGGELTRLSCLKTLELAYRYLAKDGVEDGFAAQADKFAELYQEELDSVLASGIDYDWEDDGSIGTEDKGAGTYRSLVRQ